MKHIKLFESFDLPDDGVNHIVSLIDDKMDELIGKGDYEITHHPDTNKIYVTFESGDKNDSLQMAEDVVDFVNFEMMKNIIYVGNFSEDSFWVTLS